MLSVPLAESCFCFSRSFRSSVTTTGSVPHSMGGGVLLCPSSSGPNVTTTNLPTLALSCSSRPPAQTLQGPHFRGLLSPSAPYPNKKSQHKDLAALSWVMAASPPQVFSVPISLPLTECQESTALWVYRQNTIPGAQNEPLKSCP